MPMLQCPSKKIPVEATGGENGVNGEMTMMVVRDGRTLTEMIGEVLKKLTKLGRCDRTLQTAESLILLEE